MNKLIVCVISLTILVGCTPRTNTVEDKEKKVVHDIEKLLEDLPDPSSIPFLLKSIDVTFAENLVNSLDKIEAYKSDEDKLAMNMGVYAADISYLASFEKPELTMAYVRAFQTLGNELSDSTIFKEELLDKIKANLGSKATLSKLLTRMIVETSIQLEKDHHMSMAALALAGNFIEELYQAVNVIDDYHPTGPPKDWSKEKVASLVNLVLDQQQALEDLIQLIKDIPHDDTINDILLQLNILDNLYKMELTAIKENKATNPEYVADRKSMKAITLEIKRIREKIVE